MKHMATSIVIIDDDVKLCELLHKYLMQCGMELMSASTPEKGLKLIQQTSPALIILDIMLPTRSGFDLCREIRQTSSVPIIMLTARSEITDRIVGLKLGADDYVLKPVDPAELVARIESVLRRSKLSDPRLGSVVRYNGLELNFNQRTVFLENQEVNLTTTEFSILELLVRNAGRVMSRDEILDNLRGIEWESFNRSVDVLLSRLRQKLKEDPKNPKFFRTIRGSGYLFIGVREDQKKAA